MKPLLGMLTISEEKKQDKDVINYCYLIEKFIPRQGMEMIHQFNAYFSGIDKYKALVKANYMNDIAAIHAISHAILNVAKLRQLEEYTEVIDILNHKSEEDIAEEDASQHGNSCSI